MKRFRAATILALLFVISLGFLFSLSAAELWLRESLVRERSKEILTAIEDQRG